MYELRQFALFVHNQIGIEAVAVRKFGDAAGDGGVVYRTRETRLNVHKIVIQSKMRTARKKLYHEIVDRFAESLDK